MSDAKRCPSHPAFPLDRCPRCAALIERAEAERDDPDPGGREADREADRYEQWLDRCMP
jgi:hypothetical protein